MPSRVPSFLVLCLGLVVAVAVLAAPQAAFPLAEKETITFRISSPEAQKVFLAGTFNNWSDSALPMSDPDRDGTFEVALPLEPGTYQYKFVVDGQWTEDPGNPEKTPDGFGGSNSLLTVGKGGAVAPPPAAAAAKAPSAGAPVVKSDGDTYGVTFKCSAVRAQKVFLAGTFNNWGPEAQPMADPEGKGLFQVTIPLAAGTYQYKYVVDGQWREDPNSPEYAPDGFGGQNSVLRVGPAAAPLLGLREVPFRYQAPAGARDVYLAGTFNDWSPAKTRMADADGDGVFEVTLLLEPGEYQYKFVADGQWHEDPAGSEFTDDGFGGKNTVLDVNEAFGEVEIRRGDGKILTRDLRHVQRLPDVNPLGPARVQFQAAAFAGDIEGLSVRTWIAETPSDVAMAALGDEGGLAYYRATVELPSESAELRYVFAYEDGPATQYLTPSGFVASAGPADAFVYRTGSIPMFSVPSWVSDAVFYQIFPDRFYNGDPSNDPDFKEPYYDGARDLPPGGKTDGEYFHLVREWSDASGLQVNPVRTDGKPDWYSFYGGDLKGVTHKMPYLADLGVTAIYFNPIFTARSNHKYDAADYTRVDPHFGTDADFDEMVRAAHAAGIKIVLDIVYNHCGDWHPAFRDGMLKGPQSPTYTWFEWKKWPLPAGRPGTDFKPADYYACWWGFGSLPDFNFDLSRPNPDENSISDISKAQPNVAVVDYLLEATRQWVRRGVDGFRLDVPNEVPSWFWKEFRREARAINPDVYIVGELWGDATTWLGPEMFDAVMNYRYFRDPVMKFIVQGRGDAATFDRELRPGRVIYPKQATAAMMNLIGSHDTERARTMAGRDVRRPMLAAVFAMTYEGAPHVYYGDEIGMEGGKDPDCRRPFIWTWSDEPERVKVRDHYKRLIAIRKEHAALRSGSFTTLVAQGRAYAFERAGAGERLITALNAGEEPVTLELEPTVRPADGTRYRDLVSGSVGTAAGGRVSLTLGPLQGAVLLEEAPSGAH
jgi:glycosidase